VETIEEGEFSYVMPFGGGYVHTVW
jgi:hypothetical protein